MGHVWIFQPCNNPNTNLKNNTKMGHWAPNQAYAMAIPVLWPEPCRRWVNWREEAPSWSCESKGFGVEVCTGSKLKPEPGPYPRLSDTTRPDPSGTVKFRARTRPEIPPPPPTTNSQLKKKRKKAAFHDCMQRNRLIKALPFHKHLPVMKVCEHQVQRSHTFCRVYEFCMFNGCMPVRAVCKLHSPDLKKRRSSNWH